MKKRVFVCLMALLLCASLLPVPQARATEGTTINVYNWGQYIADGSDDSLDVNAAFEEETGIHVNYMTFDSNESLYTKLKTGGSTYDVIVPSDYMVGRLIDEGMLLPLNFDNIPNFQYVDEEFRNMDHDPENLYSIPYTGGTVGVIYNSAFVDEADTGSWDLLWNEKYSGKILMFDNPRDAFAIPQAMLGHSLNTQNADELRADAQKLIAQKPLVQAYVMDQIYDKLEREEAWIAPYYVGDYIQMKSENENLSFYFPEEGFNRFVDCMCIPTCCENKEGAEAYINFLLRPDVCGQNMDYVGYTVPETAAREYLSLSEEDMAIAYPSEEITSRGQAFAYLGAETTHLMDSLWLQVKTDSKMSYVPIIGIAALAVLVCAVFLTRRSRTKRRRSGGKK